MNAAAAEMVSCDICLKEIPVSGSASDEATTYVAHFCGLACYQQWRGQQTDARPQPGDP